MKVDEKNTIHLIEKLDAESKKTLNALVQSVLMTQQDNDKEKLMLITEKRNIVALQKKLQEQTADLERQKLELAKLK